MRSDIKVDLDRLLADENMHDPAQQASVVQAYLNLIDCIATYRDQGIARRQEDIRKYN